MPYSVSPARTTALASSGIAIGGGGGRTGAGRVEVVPRGGGRDGDDVVVRDEAG
jgi:hypothetical protein